MNDATVTTPSPTTIMTTRVFDAPRELVFAAHSDCQHLKQWWGRGNPLDCEVDFRVGGRYRFVEHASDGTHGFRGEYREIVVPERIVYTFEYEGMPGHISVDTLEFTEQDGRTIITGTTTFTSQEDRDAMMTSGMEAGMNESFRALDRLLKTLV